MKKPLTEGILDLIFKALSKGKYTQVQKMQSIKGNPEVQKAVKQAEIARKNLNKAISKFEKSHGKNKSTFKKDLMKKYGR